MAAQNQEINNRIKFAYHLEGWLYEGGNQARLRASADKVLASEYRADMKGSIFCPECSCPLDRRPHDRETDKRGRAAFFAHRRGIKSECGLRTLQAEGKRYETEEEAAQAVQNGSLVIVSQFLQEQPEVLERQPGVYDQGAVEDREGELTLVPIARHRGRDFELPSRITTVRGMCRNFDQNLHKYYVMPGGQHARTLYDHLIDARSLRNITDYKVLVYGTIISVWDTGQAANNCRFIKLRYPRGAYKDFCIKVYRSSAEAHGLSNARVGRIVIVYGRIRENGIGLSIDYPAWGEIALLPAEYKRYLD